MATLTMTMDDLIQKYKEYLENIVELKSIHPYVIPIRALLSKGINKYFITGEDINTFLTKSLKTQEIQETIEKLSKDYKTVYKSIEYFMSFIEFLNQVMFQMDTEKTSMDTEKTSKAQIITKSLGIVETDYFEFLDGWIKIKSDTMEYFINNNEIILIKKKI